VCRINVLDLDSAAWFESFLDFLYTRGFCLEIEVEIPDTHQEYVWVFFAALH